MRADEAVHCRTETQRLRRERRRPRDIGAGALVRSDDARRPECAQPAADAGAAHATLRGGAGREGARGRAGMDAGASFVVGPGFRPEVIAACHERDVPAMPGCFTPTEILAAHACGADIVKLFPATMLGPQFIRDVRAPLPQVKLMPTGGVTVRNAGDWVR